MFSSSYGRDGCGSALGGCGEELCDPLCAQAVGPKLSTCYCWVLAESVLRSTSAAGEYGCLQSHIILRTGRLLLLVAWFRKHGLPQVLARPVDVSSGL